MTISINPVDSVLKAYRKHNKPLNSAGRRTAAPGTPIDTVVLSCAADKPETTEKTVYSLLDVLLQSR